MTIRLLAGHYFPFRNGEPMPRPDVSEERKAQILDAARHLFVSTSLKEVTMQEIARQSELSVGGVYWYFKSKDEVIAALIEQNADMILGGLEAASVGTGPVAERMLHFLEEVVISSDELTELYVSGAKLYAMTSPEKALRELMQRVGAGYFQGIAGLIEEGMARGEFKQVNAMDIASVILGLYEGLMLLWMLDKENIRFGESLLAGVGLILGGLTCDRSAND